MEPAGSPTSGTDGPVRTTTSRTTNGFERAAMLDRLEREEFDVVVVGGGITGAGVALDAVSRGLRTALVERDDFASGTSSKSSKMVHGGLRYLQNGEVRLVYEALHERQRLFRNAPHLVEVLPFLLPIMSRDGVVTERIAKALRSALWTYDLTGGLRIGRRHRRLDATATARHVPDLDPERLAGGFIYYDASVDDARLTLTVARTAADHGAAVANRCEVVDVPTGPDGRATGVVVVATDDPTLPPDDPAARPRRIMVRARAVVNAAGVWADAVRALDEPRPPGSIRPARGVHVNVPWERLRVDVAVVIPVPKDKRSLFVVPWSPTPDGGFRYSYVGTTDTDHDGSLDAPMCTGDDLDYVLRAVNHSFTTGLTRDDVIAVWAGLRPLVQDPAAGARTADLSRRHQVAVSDAGVVRVVGGKLTTYRSMAADAVDEVVRARGEAVRRRRSRTARLRLHGGAGFRRDRSVEAGDRHLAGRYGTDAAIVRSIIAADPSLGEPLVPGLPYRRAEAVFAALHEMAVCLDDVLERRTRAHLFDRGATERAADEVARLLAAELGWDDERRRREVNRHLERCERERRAEDHRTADVPTT